MNPCKKVEVLIQSLVVVLLLAVIVTVTIALACEFLVITEAGNLAQQFVLLKGAVDLLESPHSNSNALVDGPNLQWVPTKSTPSILFTRRNMCIYIFFKIELNLSVWPSWQAIPSTSFLHSRGANAQPLCSFTNGDVHVLFQVF